MINIPWPDSENRKIVFIIDAGHSVEQNLLEECIAELQKKSGFSGSIRQCIASIARQPEDIDASSLIELCTLPDDTLVVPMRVVWMPAPKSKNIPAAFREIAHRKQILPNPYQAKAILKKDVDRALKIAGAPATMLELRDRFDQWGGTLDNNADFCQYIVGQAGLALDIEERRHRGTRYKVPRRVGENIKASKLFREGLQQISQSTGRETDDLLRETDSIMKELIATPQPLWIDIAGEISKKITSLAYESEVVVNEEDIERTRNIIASHPTALLWTHKTHVDGMVMQQVLFEHDLPSAHTFGGLNMAFAGVSYSARKSGVIFIRRTFQDNPLYKLILRHYIGYLLEKRFPFSWAFEGTRSRIGKLMPPRYGLLKYLIEAAQTTRTKNLHFLPVAINYDLIGDVGDYAKEQAGENKRSENLSWFIGYLRGLRQPMGRIYMDFGEPVVLESPPEPGDRLAISKIAFQVAVEANRVTPITLASLATMVLLSAAPRALTRDEFASEIELLVNWVREREIRISSDFSKSNTEHAESVIEVLINNNLISIYDEQPDTLYSIAAEQQVVASYYRNTTVHHFIPKAFAELALLRAATREDSATSKFSNADIFWQAIDNLKNLFKFEFFYPSSDEFRDQIRAEMAYYDKDWEHKLQSSEKYAGELLNSFRPLVAHATLIQFAEAYWIASSVLNQLAPNDSINEANFISKSLSFGRRAYLQQRISSKSSIGKQLFKNAFGLMENLGYTDAGTEELGEQRSNIQNDLRKLINQLERIRARSLPH